ncbi:MAG: SAM-dependent methyltransferase [Nitrospinales bacterium]
MEKKIRKTTLKQNEILPSSFRDPSGFVFSSEGTIYRQINEIYKDEYEFLNDSGLYSDLTESGFLIPHDEVSVESQSIDNAYKVIEPKQIPFISYPYEWSFNQMMDAALITLEIQKRSLDHGMVLKDASAYNIQFINSKPVFIDTLSFERLDEGKPWVAYRQFCQHFLAPLALMRMKDVRLNQLLKVHIDGVPLDLASKLLPFKSKLSIGLLFHIHLHASAQKKYSGKPEEASKKENKKISKRVHLGLVDNLKSSVLKLGWEPSGTEWSDYYDETNYSNQAMNFKKEKVESYLVKVHPKSVWDLGANTGEFSKLSAAMGIPTIAFDIDPACVDFNYRACRNENRECLLPLLLDLANPSPGIGWENRERSSFMERGPVDLVMALALIHHLVISNNVPIARLAEFFSKISQNLIIEFVPKSDSQVKRLLAFRKDIFDDYHIEGFISAFSSFFEIVDKYEIPESGRTLFLLRRNDLHLL